MKLALTLALAVLAQLASAQSKPLADIPLKDINGKDTSLKDYKGKAAVEQGEAFTYDGIARS